MDLSAELTLQVLRFVQYPRAAPASPREWIFFPETKHVPWATARRLLSEAPKPLMVAPLSEPGMIGSWAMHTLAGGDLSRAEHARANQLRWLNEHSKHFCWAPTDLVLFETDADHFELPLSDLERWLREYAVTVGWTIGEGPDTTRPARLLIRKSDGDWSPGKACHVHGGSAT